MLGSLPHDLPDPERELRALRARLRTRLLRPVGRGGFAKHPVRNIRDPGPDQGDHCAAAAVVACVEVLRGVRAAPDAVRRLYAFARDADGFGGAGGGSGASLSATLRLAAEHGVPLAGSGRAGLQGYEAIGDGDEAAGAILYGAALLLQLPIYPAHLTLSTVDWPMPPPGVITESGHVLVGFGMDWRYVFALNCWGPEWGDAGKCRIPVGYPYLFAGAYAVW